MKNHDRAAHAYGQGTVISRRQLLNAGGALGASVGLAALLPGYAWASAGAAELRPVKKGSAPGVIGLRIAQTQVDIGGRTGAATTINGTLPGPLLRLREGEETIIRVTNALSEDTSLHWHGLLVPAAMDGVPGVSFPGIAPGTTFEYRFKLEQNGTYWYHSHSGLQEQLGVYGPLIIEPASGKHPSHSDREYVVVLSDWTFESPYRVLARLKKNGGYYNFQKRTVFDFFRDMGERGLGRTVGERLTWARMRMDPTDLLDVTGSTYTFLVNGHAPQSNWTGLFRPGEKVLLRFVNASANSILDVRIPGLPMTVVQASGQPVQPVETDEFRIAAAETFDVIVEPKEDRAYTLFVESMDRSGHARGTLAPREGMTAEVPQRRKRPVLGMADMGMDEGKMEGMGGMDLPDAGPREGMQMKGQDMGGMDMPDAGSREGMQMKGQDMGGMDMGGMDMGGMDMPDTGSPREGMKMQGQMGASEAKDLATLAQAATIRTSGLRAPGTVPAMMEHEENGHGPGNTVVPMMVKSRLHEPGIGLGEDGWRVLTYADLRALEKRPDFAAPAREIEMHLTGNMERYMWSMDGVPFDQSEDIMLTFGERLRLTMVNDTMMSHPMHLHGMWMELENGHRDLIPRVHTVTVKPAERLSVLITADAPGRWAFHCHLLFHMEVGMFRVFSVSEPRPKGPPGP